MDITFIGAARTVTGSLHLFEYNKRKFLLECGLYQGHREEAERINRTFSFKPKDIQAVVLSHAHLDHSGNLPNLVKCGFSGPIYCTAATKDVATLLLMDSAKIQEYDFAFLNKKRKKAGLPPKELLYTQTDVDKTIELLTPVAYEEPFEPVKGVNAKLFDAGHILGSSMIELETDSKRILFSGDLGRKNMPIIKDPAIVKEIDYLITESTYGGRTHKSIEEMTDEFRRIIKKGRDRKSKIIIPAFAVERTQVLVTILKNLYDEGTLEGVPVYVDSPLATNVTDVFRRHPECFDKETREILQESDPFNFPGLQYVKDNEESKRLNAQQGPMIIMSASGMCEGGRVVHHLIHSIENDDNIIVLTGFQVRGTLGRNILDGNKKVHIFNDEYRVRAQVHFMGGLSAHADGNDLVEYVQNCDGGTLKKVYLIHGDIEESTALQEKLTSQFTIDVNIPQSMTHVTV